MSSLRLVLVAAVLLPLLSGCLQRGDVAFDVEAPRPDAWTPGGLLEAAVRAGGGDLDRTRLLAYGATFDESGVLRILELRVFTHDAAGDGFYLDYFVGQDYDAADDSVRFLGYRHDEATLGQRPDPAKEFDLTNDVLAVLGWHSFAELAANETAGLAAAPYALEFRVGADCQPTAAADGEWHVYNSTAGAVVDAGEDWELTCYARPRLPPTLLVNVHSPCYRGPACPDADVDQFLINHPQAGPTV